MITHRKCRICQNLLFIGAFVVSRDSKEYKSGRRYYLDCADCLKSKSEKPRKVSEPRDLNDEYKSLPFSKQNFSKYLWLTYKLTYKEWQEMYNAQEGKCAICSTFMPLDIKRQGPQTDHDHSTGKVRQLLCRNCNQGLGSFKDNSEWLRLAADYIDKHKS